MREQSALSGKVKTHLSPHTCIRSCMHILSGKCLLARTRAKQKRSLRAQVAKNGLLCLQDMFRGLERLMDPEIKVVCAHTCRRWSVGYVSIVSECGLS